MRIERIDVRLLRLPLVRFFETSFGRVHDRTLLLITAFEQGAEGWAECVADASPYYSPETTETAWHVITEFLAPRVLGASLEHPRDAGRLFEAVRGHQMAKAAVEMALWDLHAHQRAEPLSLLLGGTAPRVVAGVSVGIQDSLDDLLRVVEAELAAGYRRVKIKIKPGWDVEAVRAIRARFGTVPLMADANGAYTLDQAERLQELDEFGLMMIEQPLGYDDVFDHARLQSRLSTPICLDESIHDARLAAEALDMGACRIINIKPGRLGGHAESVRVHDACVRRRAAVWHGGMLETGIGRAHNLHLATLPGFTLPGDIAASRRYFLPDLIDPAIEVAADGTIEVPHGPGIGVHIVRERVEAATQRWLSLPR